MDHTHDHDYFWRRLFRSLLLAALLSPADFGTALCGLVDGRDGRRVRRVSTSLGTDHGIRLDCRNGLFPARAQPGLAVGHTHFVFANPGTRPRTGGLVALSDHYPDKCGDHAFRRGARSFAEYATRR